MGDEEAVYQITKDDGSVGKSSRDYTGKGLAVYINKDTYNGDFVDGVEYFNNMIGQAW
jgi:hypothetical protein